MKASIAPSFLMVMMAPAAFATPPASATAAPAASTSACYPDEPKIVTVTGTLIEKDRHDRDSHSGGKEIDGYFVLRFTPPICTIGSSDAETHEGGYYDSPNPKVVDVQMVLLDDSIQLYTILKPDIGKKVQCTGQLFDAQTAGHRTPVLIQIMRKEDCQAVK